LCSQCVSRYNCVDLWWQCCREKKASWGTKLPRTGEEVLDHGVEIGFTSPPWDLGEEGPGQALDAGVEGVEEGLLPGHELATESHLHELIAVASRAAVGDRGLIDVASRTTVEDGGLIAIASRATVGDGGRIAVASRTTVDDGGPIAIAPRTTVDDGGLTDVAHARRLRTED
jgi:hypothetical protein